MTSRAQLDNISRKQNREYYRFLKEDKRKPPRRDAGTTVHLFRQYKVGYNYLLPATMYSIEFALLYRWIRANPDQTPIVKYDRPWLKEWRAMIPKKRKETA